ncbi:MAG: Uncharacterized protein LiPW15_102 [Parcubacteria group bacterium LiPW_15]|nr:MAG: Uncharacterized protein LiPW15_102 [Parcubacteria group bacterium LiPW_15]
MTLFLGKLFASDWFWSLGDIFLGIVLFSAIGLYAYRESSDASNLGRRYVLIAKLIIWARILYSGFITCAQYLVWSQSEVSRIFLTLPADARSLPMYGFLAPIFKWSGGYFTLYSFLHFWLPTLISIAIGYIFLVFLRLLRKHKDRFFESGEVELGWVLALIVGYPNFIIFLPLVFFLIIPISIVRMAVLKQHLTTIGYPMILSAIFAVILGTQIMDVLGWGALKLW